MFLKIFQTFVVLVVSSCGSAPLQAAIQTVADWHLTTDSLGGLRQSTTAPDVYYAISKSTTWVIADTYEAPDGYHWASTAEGLARFPSANTSTEYTYWNQAGWNGYEWEGEDRYHFRFSDSSQTNATKLVGFVDGHALGYNGDPNGGGFAGLVLIRDDSGGSVPEPTSLIVWGLLGAVGLKRRRR